MFFDRHRGYRNKKRSRTVAVINYIPLKVVVPQHGQSLLAECSSNISFYLFLIFTFSFFLVCMEFVEPGFLHIDALPVTNPYLFLNKVIFTYGKTFSMECQNETTCMMAMVMYNHCMM